MQTHSSQFDKIQHSTSIATPLQQKSSSQRASFTDNRPLAIAQKKTKQAIQNSPRVKQLKAIRQMMNQSIQSNQFQGAEAANGNVAQMKSFYHYTDKAGHDGIKASKTMWPSTEDGLAHTHYGKGHYFADIDPHFDAAYMGMPEFGERLFNKLSKSNAPKMLYYVEVETSGLKVDQQVDDKYGFPLDIYLHESEENLDITDRYQDAGETYFGQLASLGDDPTKFTGTSRKKKKQQEPSTNIDYDKMGYWGVD